jgi:uncharacterized membrane protein
MGASNKPWGERGRLLALVALLLLFFAGPAPAFSAPGADFAGAVQDHEHDHSAHGAGTEGDSLASAAAWLGRFHPLAVHFPIALLLLAAAAEALSAAKRDERYSWTARTCLWVGTAGALLAAPLGWMSASGREASTLLTSHRWLGVATAAVALLTLICCECHRRKGGDTCRLLYRVGLGLGVVLVTVTGHLGATLVFGDLF